MQSHKSMGLNGKKIFVHVFGCRSSLCEGEYIAGEMKSRGAEITEELGPKIDAAVIVTCSVTNEADRKCRQLIKRVRRTMKDSCVLAVCGCWSQKINIEAAKDSGIDILCGTKGKNILPEILESEILSEQKTFHDIRTKTQDIFMPSEWEELEIASPVMHSRAFMKIQDGCDHFCTYCIIPFLRGRPVSRPIENITGEIKRLIQNGTKEIIFTGIHLGIYGHDINTDLAQLIRNVSEIDGLKRLRMGSLEPFCLDENLLNALSECEAFCHHLHLPLQSGDDEILSAMRRGYNARGFVNVCCKAREKLGDDLHISSDILVGFPGETGRAFQNTLDIMKISGLGRVHVFPFSERKGTFAESMAGKISHDVKISRTAEAISLGRKLYQDYVKKFEGREVEILIENNNKGHTGEYIEAICSGYNYVKNEIIKLRAVREVNGKLECMRRD